MSSVLRARKPYLPPRRWFPPGVPFRREPLGLRYLSGRHQEAHLVPHLDGIFITSGGGEVGPLVSQDVVLRNAFAAEVHETEVELSPGVPLLGGQREPP